jgi:hypothetical protein
VDLQILTSFRPARGTSPRTWTKELGTFFFRFCPDSDGLLRSSADKVPMPNNHKPREREPYEPNQISKIIAACDTIGRRPLRAAACAGDGAGAALHCASESRMWRR